MPAAQFSVIIKMKRQSNQHNTNGNSIMTKETEGDLSTTALLSVDGERFNGGEKTPLRNGADLIGTRLQYPHEGSWPSVASAGGASPTTQKLLLNLAFCSVGRKTWERGRANFTGTVHLVMLHLLLLFCRPLHIRARARSCTPT